MKNRRKESWLIRREREPAGRGGEPAPGSERNSYLSNILKVYNFYQKTQSKSASWKETELEQT